MTSIVIADASPLIALARIEHLHLLHSLFGQVSMTITVQQEVMFSQAFIEINTLQAALDAGWLQIQEPIVDVDTDPSRNKLVDGLDPGERSSIEWAAHLKATQQNVILIMDEAKGRKVARQLELDILGSAGIIAIAKRQELISAAKPLLEQLQASGYFLSDTVMDMALKIAGER